MISLVAILLAQSFQVPAGPVYSDPSKLRSAAFFEFAPTSGAGMGAVCGCTAITGSKGEAITHTRASSAYCTREGVATSGLTTTSMTLCGSNLPRVELDGNSVLGLRSESSSTNAILRSAELNNAAWTATATVTADQATTPWGALAAEQLDDASAVAQNGVSQTATSATTTRWAASCYVRAGTASSATITMTGVGDSAGDCTASVTGLSAVTWSRITCRSPLSYGAGVTGKTIAVLVGDTAAVTGTIMASGCQLEDGSFASSYIATTSATANRPVETFTVVGSTFPAVAYSKAATITTLWSDANAPGLPALLIGQLGTASGTDFFIVSNALRIQNCNGACVQLTSAALGVVAGVPMRLAGLSGGGSASLFKDGVLILGPSALADALAPNRPTTGIADNKAGLSNLSGIISRVCWDSNQGFCR